MIIPLQNVCEFFSGNAWKADFFNKNGQGLPIIRIQNVDNQTDFAYWNHDYDKRFIIRSGDLLLSLSGSFRIAEWSGNDALLNQRVVKLIPKEVDKLYLLYVLRDRLKEIETIGRHALVNNVALSDLKQIKIFLPPLEEQKRIAAILDKADAIRRKRVESLRLLDDLLRATFLDIFGDPISNPKGWPTKTLGSLALKFSDGPFGSNLKSEHYTPDGIRVIRLQNIGVGKFIDNDKANISFDHFETLQKHKCIPGDVIIGTLGDPNLRACMLPDNINVAINKADCVQCRVNPDLATPEFIESLLNEPATLSMISHLLHGQTRVRISMGKLRQFEIPTPPLEMQQKFSLIYNKLSKISSSFDESLNELNTLFHSLVARAFKGEL